MSGLQITANVDPVGIFGRQLSELERSQLPFATMQAINQTAFDVRQRWAEIMPRVFDRPTPLTLKAVLYRKASRQNLAADIFIRDEASKGTPPAKYLQAQVSGGSRRQKGIEKRLSAAGILPQGQFVVPGLGVKLDAFGNVPRSQLNQILSQLGAHFDPLTNQTDTSRDRRHKRELGKRGPGFTSDVFAVKQARGRLKPGVYLRANLGRLGSGVKSLLRFVDAVRYRKRYDIFQAAQTIYARRFPENFRTELGKAVASSWVRTFK